MKQIILRNTYTKLRTDEKTTIYFDVDSTN
jgi:hypothetical protein